MNRGIKLSIIKGRPGASLVHSISERFFSLCIGCHNVLRCLFWRSSLKPSCAGSCVWSGSSDGWLAQAPCVECLPVDIKLASKGNELECLQVGCFVLSINAFFNHVFLTRATKSFTRATKISFKPRRIAFINLYKENSLTRWTMGQTHSPLSSSRRPKHRTTGLLRCSWFRWTCQSKTQTLSHRGTLRVRVTTI